MCHLIQLVMYIIMCQRENVVKRQFLLEIFTRKCSNFERFFCCMKQTTLSMGLPMQCGEKRSKIGAFALKIFKGADA